MIAQTAQKFGKLPSQLLEIEDKATALDFDLACNLRLEMFQNEKDFERLKIYKIQFKNALSEWWGNLPDSLQKSEDDNQSDDEIITI